MELTWVSGINAAAYQMLGWSEPWAPSAIGNSSFMFAESGQLLLNRSDLMSVPLLVDTILQFNLSALGSETPPSFLDSDWRGS